MATRHYLFEHPDGLVAGSKPERLPNGRATMKHVRTMQRIACMPSESKVFVMLTAIPASVNCAECRMTPEWKEAFDKEGKPKLHAVGVKHLINLRRQAHDRGRSH